MMKALLASTLFALTLAAGSALAQPQPQAQAAATLPDAFSDAGAAPATAIASAPAVRAHPGSEAALRAVVADAGDGDLDLGRFTPSLAAQLRGGGADMAARIRAFGALRSVEHAGQENGADLYLATFSQARTQWIVGVDAEDRVSALLFRRVTEAD